MEDEMWPFMGMAKRLENGHGLPFLKPPSDERRWKVLNAAEEAIARFRLAVYAVTNTGTVGLAAVVVTDDRIAANLIHCEPSGDPRATSSPSSHRGRR